MQDSEIGKIELTTDARSSVQTPVRVKGTASDPAGVETDYRRRDRTLGVACLCIGLLLVCMMPTNQSYWIDDAFTLPYSSTSTFDEFMMLMTTGSGSEPVMPLGMFSFFVGEKISGRSERALRGVSALWAALAVVMVWRIGLLIGMPWLVVIFACHPFLWYYTNEIRPYTMAIAGGAGLLYALIAVQPSVAEYARGITALSFFVPLLCGATVIATVPCGLMSGYIAVVLLLSGWKPSLRDSIKLAVSAGLVVSLGAYYLWTLDRAALPHWSQTLGLGIASPLFSAYELLGFAGFGPDRYALREAAVAGGIDGVLQSILGFSTVGLFALALLYLVAARRLVTRWGSVSKGDRRVVAVLLSISLLSVGLVYLICSAKNFTFWGRHLSPLLPLVVVVAMYAADAPERGPGRKPSSLVVFLAVALLSSSLLVRFHPDHRRDDYRAAAAFALSASRSGETVWWLAAHNCGTYYGLDLCNPGEIPKEGCVVNVAHLGAKDLVGLSPPDVVVFSKPDLFDRTGAVRQYLEENDYSAESPFKAFQLFRPR